MCPQKLCHFYYIDVVYVQYLTEVAKIRIIVAFHVYTPFIIYPILYTSCELEFTEYCIEQINFFGEGIIPGVLYFEFDFTRNITKKMFRLQQFLQKNRPQIIQVYIPFFSQ